MEIDNNSVNKKSQGSERFTDRQETLSYGFPYAGHLHEKQRFYYAFVVMRIYLSFLSSERWAALTLLSEFMNDEAEAGLSPSPKLYTDLAS